MSEKFNSEIAVIGIDIGKNSFHIVGLDDRGAIVLRQKWSRNQVEVRFANMPPCLIGMEACVGAHPAEVCERIRRDGGSVFPAHANTGDPDGPIQACPLMRTHARRYP